ncbi:unnamed protein product [Durusdinium trenchii]|uniref:Uncharacterized protein n=1 Tax=Durusdinium trenchii TaxID=1381693 RepID=A0ABP0SMP1_9DINO
MADGGDFSCASCFTLLQPPGRFVATPLAEQEEDPLNVWAKEELQQRASNVQFLQSRWYFDAPWRPLGFDAGSLQELRHVAAVRSIVALANTSGAEEMTRLAVSCLR